MKKVNILTMMAFATLLITSCKEDYFDSDEYSAMMREAFPVDNIDPQHTWSTIGSAEVSVNVNLKQGETYQAHIYDQNPIDATGSLNLLGQGSVKSGSTLTTTINYPLSLSYVYLALFDQKGYMIVYPLTIDNGHITDDINAAQQAQSRQHRTIASQFTFPSAPADSDFPSVRDANAELITGYKDGNNFYIDESINGNGQTIQPNVPWNVADKNIKLYVQGNVRPSGFYVPANTTLYLLPGSKLTLPNNYSFGQGNCIIYVGAGAELICGGKLQLASNARLNNRGTVTTDQIEVTNSSVFYNESPVSISGALTATNNNSVIVNDSKLTVASVGIYGSSHLLSNDTILVSGETTVNSNNNTWVNNGYYETQKFNYTAGSSDVINNCHLVVNDLFYIGLGDTNGNGFQLDGGASVVTKEFQFRGPGFIRQGSGSLFKVTGTAKFSINNDVYGIYGPITGDYAVFQAKAIERLNAWETNQGFSANYFGHLYVACDSHFPFGYSDKSAAQQAAGEVGAQPYYRLDAASGALMTTYGGADVHVTDNGCGADYDGTPGEEPQAQSFSLRYCFEDNFPEMGDYDLNDAVITVTPTTNGTTTVQLRVSLDAVGATKQIAAALRVKGLNDSDVASCTREGNLDADFPTNASVRIIESTDIQLPASMKTSSDLVLPLFNNAHWTLGRTITSVGSVENVFLNTVKRDNAYQQKRNDIEPAVATYTITLKDAAKAALFTQENLDVFIVEGYNGGYWEVHTVPFKTDEVLSAYVKNVMAKYNDNVPWAICVPGNDFKYPIEWQSIGIKEGSVITGAYQEYGHSFAEWAEDHTKATDWYKYPTAGLVYE